MRMLHCSQLQKLLRLLLLWLFHWLAVLGPIAFFQMEPVWEEVKPQSKKPFRRPFQDPPRRSYPDNSDKRKVAQLVYHLAVSETKQNVLNSKYEAESRLLQAAQDQLNLVLAEKRHLELCTVVWYSKWNQRSSVKFAFTKPARPIRFAQKAARFT